MSLGDRLRQRRLELGLSRGQLGRAARLASDYIRQVEHGQIQRPDPARLAQLARALGWATDADLTHPGRLLLPSPPRAHPTRERH